MIYAPITPYADELPYVRMQVGLLLLPITAVALPLILSDLC